EADSTQVDSLLAGIGSFLLVALLIFAGFRELRRPFFALLALMIGMAWTTGFASLFFGQLNLITIAFVIILIGLGIEYGIHFLSRYLWERKEGHETTAAISKTLEHTGRAIGIGGITAAAAFLTAIFTHFKGLQQLGIIAGAGVIFCFLAEVTILPSLLMLFDTHKQTNKTIPANKQVRFDFLVKHPKPTIIVLSVFTLIGLIVAPSLHFDSNLLNLQDQKLESLVFEKIIQDNTEQSTWFLTYHTKDLNDLYDKQTRVAQLSSVKKTDSLFQLVPQNQKERLLQLQDLQKKLQHSHVPASPQNLPQQVDLLKTQVATLTNQAFKNGMIEEFNELNSLNDTLGKQSDTLRAAKRVPFENNFLTFVNRLQGELHSLLTPSLVTEAELPSKLLSLYKSANGSYSLTIYPHKDIWDPQNQEEFINQVRTIIPDVTGAPVTTYESAKRLVSGFLLVALLTSLIILFAIWAEFREIRASLFVFGNLVISLIWLVGYLYIRDLSINLANFFALP
ncbi:MAG TPA: MMPL family transporter, partial [bacterium]|nr:MMPL family transporter [bacterium]